MTVLSLASRVGGGLVKVQIVGGGTLWCSLERSSNGKIEMENDI